MSRNLRHKSSASPAKQSARRASHHADNSSDDDYAGVDLISDSEDDEPDVEAAEEQAIIESAEEDDGDNELADVPQPDNDQSSWNGFDDEPVLGGDEAFFDDHMARSHAPDTLTHATTYNATHGNSSDERETPRRVRFDLSASSEDEDDSMFPDIFLDQNSLDPGFRRIIESNHGIDEHMASSEDGSYWDYRGEEHRNVVEVPDDESDGSSGYETDEGETTEEDLPNVAKYIPARTVLRGLSEDSESEEEVPMPRRAIKSRGPRLGSWVHDRDKPFVAFNKNSQKLLVFKSTRRYIPNSISASPMESDMEIASIEQSPMFSNSANLMMSAVYGPPGNFFGALGPPEAFMPFTSISADGTIIQDSISSYDEEDLTDEDNLNVEDFLTFGEGDSDGRELETQDDSGETAAEPPSTPADATYVASENQAHPLLDHFNPGVVGAFRRNQNLHQLISRNATTHNSLAFSGLYGQDAIRGIKANRLAAANTPITSIRRHNFSSMMPPSTESPKKRKFEGVQYTHKRNRKSF